MKLATKRYIRTCYYDSVRNLRTGFLLKSRPVGRLFYCKGQNMNHEHYPDPTADKACANVDREKREIARLIRIAKEICALAGYEIIGDIHIKKK